MLEVQAGYAGSTVLNSVDLAIPNEQVTILIGPNGCGKSTLLKTMARILQPTRGNVLLDGKDIHVNRREKQAKSASQRLQREIQELDSKLATMLDRMIDATSPTVQGAFEKRIGELERARLVLEEKKANCTTPKAGFDETFELAFGFLASPLKLWRLGRLDVQKTVLRLAFSDNIAYARNRGFRTPKTTTPFKALGADRGPFEMMAEGEGFSPVFRTSHCPV